jgi:hypothetical protein
MPTIAGSSWVWIQRTSGIVLQIKTHRTTPGDFQVEIPVEYSRGGPRRQKLPHVKIHLTFDEPLVTEPVLRAVKPQYIKGGVKVRQVPEEDCDT